MRVIAACLLVLASCAADVVDAPVDDPEDEDIVEEEADSDPDVADIGELAAAPGCVAHGTLGGHDVWLHFTRPPAPCRPTATAGVDGHVLGELVRLIDSVPAGGRIDGHIFNITVDSVAAALVRAQDRGVAVWISTDRQVGRSTDSAKTQYLDRLAHKVYCGTSATASCIGASNDAISHTKLFVFSTATAPDGSVHAKVAWFGSANQTQASGMKTFNNTVTVYGDGPLYDRFRGYLDDLFAQRRRTDYYDPSSGRGHILAAAADVYVSPETGTDLVVNRLDDIAPNSDCRVRVMQASIRDSRMDVVNRVITLKRGGCRVWVVASTVEPRALAALRGAGISVHRHHIHDKVFLIHGRFSGADQFRVYTGSHNLSISANQKYDEIFVKLGAETAASHPVYDAYFTHFNDAYNDGETY
jgi:phosphatidylserine/phosphatidylglycerophosphate/cardiolipin synthase-like enzyme